MSVPPMPDKLADDGLTFTNTHRIWFSWTITFAEQILPSCLSKNNNNNNKKK
jgi:hypothetical protein